MTAQEFPYPKRYFTQQFLQSIWEDSKDAKGDGAFPGIDNVRAREFQKLLHYNLPILVQKLRLGKYSFNTLRPIPILKNKDPKKYRIICVPTVEDRLIQRAINYCLVQNAKVKKIQSSISYGVQKGREWSTWAALRKARDMRLEKQWVFKTDIQSFFDSVDRSILKKRLERLLGKSSLMPLLNQIIETEISDRVDHHTKFKIGTTKIKKGVGLRQGMPLSPLLSTILLADFDKKITKLGIPLLRYVDDIIAFGNSKNDVQKIHETVQKELKVLNLTIPDLEDETKTTITKPDEPVEFLGINISRKGDNYNFKVPKEAVSEILAEIKEICLLENLRKKSINYKGLILKLEQKQLGYINYYKTECENFDWFLSKVKETTNYELKNILHSLIGEEIFKSMSQEAKTFLGINLEI